MRLKFVDCISEGLAFITFLSLCFSIGILKYLLFSCLLSFFKAGVLNSSSDSPAMLIIIVQFLAPAFTVGGAHVLVLVDI